MKFISDKKSRAQGGKTHSRQQARQGTECWKVTLKAGWLTEVMHTADAFMSEEFLVPSATIEAIEWLNVKMSFNVQ